MNTNHTLNVLLCEDEEVSLRVNEAYVKEINRVHHIDSTIYCCDTTKMNPMDILKEKQIQIAFLDIRLRENDGIQLAKEFLLHNGDMAIIFISNYSEYCMEAFKLKAFGYILKPVVQEELEIFYLRAVTYVMGLFEKRENAVLDFICNRENIAVLQKNIIYMEKVQRKVNIVTKNKTFSPYLSVLELEKRLGSEFVKINQGTIVNSREILLRKGRNVTMSTGECLMIGRIYMKKLKY